MTGEDRARDAWQACASDAAPPAIATVREAAARFDRRIRARNRLEGAAAIVVVLVFGWYAIALPSPLMRIGSLMVIAGTAVVMWQLFRRAGSLGPSDAAELAPLLRHRRDALDRQRRALASVPLWYIGPLVPGATLFLFAPLIERGVLTIPAMISITFVIAVFGGVIWLNSRAARGLGQEVAEIDAQLAER